MSKPAVVVAIVSYKSADLTVCCLQSVCVERQAAEFPISVIVVDNASGDFAEVARAIEANSWTSWVTLIEAPHNGGFGYGNNIAIRRAFESGSPEFIHFLNPDTEVRPGAIIALADFLEHHASIGIVGSSFEQSDGSDWPIAFQFPSLWSELCQGLDIGIVSRLFKRWLVPRQMARVAQRTDWVSGASMMVRTAVFARIGGFDEGFFLYFEETEFSHRALRAGFSTWYVPASRVMHVMGYTTKVTSVATHSRRFPGYWFESRRRYFVLTHGNTRAKLIDIVAIGASWVGWLKRALLNQRHRVVPYWTRDLWQHSILRRRNQAISRPITSLTP
jgi:GT2 family glycosyltransferase